VTPITNVSHSRTISLLLCAPPYVFITFWALAHSWYSDKLKNRFWFFMYPIPITIVGFVIFMVSNNFGAKYFSLFLMCFIFTMNGTTYAWIAGAIPRPPAKRAAAFAFINSIGNSASIWTPFTYRPGDKPHYRPALGINIALQTIAGICGLWLRYVLTQRNKRLERLENEDVPLSEKDLARLRKTAEVEGIDLAAARRLQKGYRYMI
jgi:Na+/melibiose symporter-like transporter